MTMKLFDTAQNALFLRRPNRFVIECDVQGKTVRAYLPNPGRLRDLLLPGRTVHIVENARRDGMLSHTCIAVDRDGSPVMLHTHQTNSVADLLIRKGMLPGFEGYRVVRREVSMGSSRFDFLLRDDREDLVLEVKSCTLFGREIAMFPDAVTERGRRHLVELAGLKERGTKGGVLFLVHSPHVRYFMPDYHTDFDFSRTLYELRNDILIRAIAVRWKEDLTLGDDVRTLDIPWDVIGREARDEGSYLVILRREHPGKIVIGDRGAIDFPEGYYIYVGSGRRNLTARIERHRRVRKTLRWHIDYLRKETRFVAALPVRGTARLECAIAGMMENIADWSVPGFGSSDCSCRTHLFGMRDNPIGSDRFISLLQEVRIDRLDKDITEKTSH